MIRFFRAAGFAAAAVLGFVPATSSATLAEGYSCILEMSTNGQDENFLPCRVALIEDRDLMVFLMGQAYASSGRLAEAFAIYDKYKGTGYDLGASLGRWSLEKFVLGNKTDARFDFKRNAEVKKLLNKAIDRGDRMAYFILKGYATKNISRIKNMADDGNQYAAAAYVFMGDASIESKKEYVDLTVEKEMPLGYALMSIYGNTSSKAQEEGISREYAADMSRKAKDSGSHCSYLAESIMYQYGYAVEKDVTKSSQLLDEAKESCWYADDYSDFVWR